MIIELSRPGHFQWTCVEYTSQRKIFIPGGHDLYQHWSNYKQFGSLLELKSLGSYIRTVLPNNHLSVTECPCASSNLNSKRGMTRAE